MLYADTVCVMQHKKSVIKSILLCCILTLVWNADHKQIQCLCVLSPSSGEDSYHDLLARNSAPSLTVQYLPLTKIWLPSLVWELKRKMTPFTEIYLVVHVMNLHNGNSMVCLNVCYPFEEEVGHAAFPYFACIVDAETALMCWIMHAGLLYRQHSFLIRF